MKLRLALIFVLVALFSHLYLTNHYYELSFGLSGEGSVCNINKAFSCDTVSASRYASFLGIPMAAWGAGTSVILLLLLFGWMIRWTDDVLRLSRYTFYLAGFTAAVSVVMGSISIFLIGTYCLFCIATYISSFVVFELLRRSLEPDSRSFKDHLLALVGPAKTYLVFIVAVPALAFLINTGILTNYGAKNLSEFVNSSIADWQSAPSVSISASPSMEKGASAGDALVVIEEFADFRCGHCKTAAPSVAAFVNSRSDVRLRFYNFPLDSTCNEGLNFGDGVSCLLARATTCGESLAGKGWDTHDAIFKKQDVFGRSGLKDAESEVLKIASSVGIEEAGMKTCLDDQATWEKVKLQASEGRRVGVKGTPTFYVNGRRLPRAQSLHVLEKAYQLTKTKN
jgi:protein-disulfide isomerase/uncharacterized membrane protein